MADTKTTYITLDNLTRYNNNIKATYETIANVALKADDNKVVHLDGTETITGVKTFSNAIVGDLTGTAAKATADAAGNVIVDTYATKEEVSKIITAEIVVISSVSDLPTQPTEKEKKTIYLVPNGSSETSNTYGEYVWASTKWEKIGTTQVGLSNYVTLDGAETITGVKTFVETIVGSVEGNADTATLAETATKAVQDGEGNVIAETYLKSASISGATDEEIDALFN